MPDYVVQYGRSAFVGRFAHPQLDIQRGGQVVIQSPRGVERGRILSRVENRFLSADSGELLRIWTPDDDVQSAEADTLAAAVLREAEQLPHPVAMLDCEVLHDQQLAILHVLPWEACDLDASLQGLSVHFGLSVKLMDVSQAIVSTDPPEPKTSCGSGNCGSGGGGCGTGGGCRTGSCSKGSVKSAAELTSYFAGLRQQMETSPRIPLNS